MTLMSSSMDVQLLFKSRGGTAKGPPLEFEWASMCMRERRFEFFGESSSIVVDKICPGVLGIVTCILVAYTCIRRLLGFPYST